MPPHADPPGPRRRGVMGVEYGYCGAWSGARKFRVQVIEAAMHQHPHGRELRIFVEPEEATMGHSDRELP